MKLFKNLFLFLLFTFLSLHISNQNLIANVLYGYASWYGIPFHGRKTASGEVFNMNNLTAAHRTLPFGTYVKVTNLSNNKSVVVKINDRGPFKPNRIIDLSKSAAENLEFIQNGISRVKLEILEKAPKSNLSYTPSPEVSEKRINGLIPLQSVEGHVYQLPNEGKIPNERRNKKIENYVSDIEEEEIYDSNNRSQIPKVADIPDMHLKNQIKSSPIKYVELDNPKEDNQTSNKKRHLKSYDIKDFPSYKEAFSELNQFENPEVQEVRDSGNYYHQGYHENPKGYLGEIIKDRDSDEKTSDEKTLADNNIDTDKEDSDTVNPNPEDESFGDEDSDKDPDQENVLPYKMENKQDQQSKIKIYSKKENQFYKLLPNGSVMKIHSKKGYRLQFGAYSQLNVGINYQKKLSNLNIPTEFHMVVDIQKPSLFKLVTKKVFDDHSKISFIKEELKKENIKSFVIFY